MRRKVCPYCDQVMKNGIYCGECRRIVWHPEVREIDYYLNERHAESEEHCSYHGDLRTGKVQHRTPSLPGRSVPRGQSAAGRASATKFRFPASKAQGREPKEVSPKQRRQIKRLQIIALTYFLIVLFGAVIRVVVKVKMKQDAGQNVTVAEASERAEKTAEVTVTGQSGRDLTSEEVRKAGIACNSYRHFPCTAEQVRELFEEKFNGFFGFLTEEGGPDAAAYTVYAYNREEGDRTLYSEEYEYALMQEGEIVGYAGLYFDTATSELHGISLVVFFDDEEVYSTAADLLADVFAELGLYDGEIKGSEMLHELLVKGRSYDDTVAVGDTAQFTLAFVGEKGEYLRMNIFGV
ncbi:MAG: hypothetical protein HFE83_00230 [Lachnospiraceae bacterium]|jgi:hypothetical protein|nr:hypothetical protein [Lachnospiraceae bacterium]